MGLKLEIITPEYVLYRGEVESVTVPSKGGQFQMLKNHAAIVSTLEKGEIIISATQEPETKHSKVESKGKNSMIKVDGGTIELNNNHLIILAE
uniref:hypothetical protein n=1 Tax=Ornithobacterium rhinotracheale TaxID=28251 RepID=UPI0039A62100